MRSATQIAEVKALAAKIAKENDTHQFLQLTLRMHRLLDELLGDLLKPRVN